MWSRFEFDGWQGHFRRTSRWYRRLSATANNWAEFSMDEQIDVALVFFQAAYHFRDYLAREQAASKEQLDDLMRLTPSLRVCRDICLGAKHREIDRPSVDADVWILREYRGSEDWRLIVKAGRMWDLLDLATQCMHAWDGFLVSNNLDPKRLSGPATRLAAAVSSPAQA